MVTIVTHGNLSLHCFYALQKPLFHLSIVNHNLFISAISLRFPSIPHSTGERCNPRLLTIFIQQAAACMCLLLEYLYLSFQFSNKFIFSVDDFLQFLYLIGEDALVHFFHFGYLEVFLLLCGDIVMLLFEFLDPAFIVLILLCFLVQFAVEFQGLLSEYDHLLLEILDAIVRGKHLFLLL